MDEYRAANRANWDDRVPIHLGADEYRVEALIRDPKLLSAVVTHDRAVFGDVRGRTLLHAQCHIGTDTLSWARLGAQVTGFDFSADAIAAARSLATRMALPARFIEAELYAAADIIPQSFDLVYTGVGAICWLPDIAGWARMMAHFCRPGGRFFIRDAHPMLMALALRDDSVLEVTEPYFEQPQPTRWENDGTYAGTGTVARTITYEWNHGLGEIVTALLEAGFRIDAFREHRSAEWRALGHMVADGERWVLPPAQRDRLPLMFSIRATRLA